MSSSKSSPMNRSGASDSSLQEEKSFDPYIPAHKHLPEMTFRATLVGIFFAALFGISSTYLALCVGRTIGGSIPISVLVMSLFRGKRKMSILENNLVQCIGSAGGSVAGSIVYTTVAFLFMTGGHSYFHYSQLMTLALIGGILGIFLMIPLRRSLIVKEHQTLPYPEGTACAEVLIAGERQGDIAKPVFVGSWIAILYWTLMKLAGLWKEVPYLIHRKAQDFYPNAALPINLTPEYLGIGYLIGPKATLQMVAGGVLAWLMLVPLFSAFPEVAAFLHAKDVYTTLSDLGLSIGNTQGLPTAAQVHAAHIKSIAMGAVVGAGLIALLKNFAVIKGSFQNVVSMLRSNQNKMRLRTDQDLPMSAVVAGAVLLVLMLALLPHLPGRFPASLLLSAIVLICGFFFVTVSSRFVGVFGYTVDPVSSMMFTTVMATCLLFVVLGFTSAASQLTVVLVGAIVSLAAGISGATSQDLKTGFLVGATPKKQQYGLLLGVVVAGLLVGLTLLLIDQSIPGVPHAIGYVAPGEEAPQYSAPQATLLAMLIKAVLGGKLAWGLVLVGAAFSVVLHFSGMNALSVAAGMYLSISTTMAMLVGSLLKWWVGRKRIQPPTSSPPAAQDTELSKGTLYATGLVAGGALAGMILGLFKGFLPKWAAWMNIGHDYWNRLEPWGDYIAIFIFVLLAATLYGYARKDHR